MEFKNFITALCIFTGIGGAAVPSHAQESLLQWPQVTNEMKPWTRWWWMGSAVDKPNLKEHLQTYRNAGLGGVEITPIYGVKGTESRFINYLSSQWMDMLSFTLQEAGRIGLGVDMANASGWPFGGPWVDERTSSKTLRSKVWHLKGGETLKDSVTFWQQPYVRMQNQMKMRAEDVKYPLSANQPRQVYAFDQVQYRKKLPLLILTANRFDGTTCVESIDLTDKVRKDRLNWKAPKGNWTLCALFEGEHGKMVERAAPGGEGYVIDHLANEPLNAYLNKFDGAFKGYDLSGLRYFFNDSYEVDDASGESDWTPALFSEFEKRRGYDLRKYLPALLGKDTPEMTERVLYDFRTTIGELLEDKYTKGWRQWAVQRGKGIRNQAHGSPANTIDLYAISDVPETEGRTITDQKLASSAAHLTGKKLTSAESCTWLDEHFLSNLGNVRSHIDVKFLAGVNHIFYHGTTYSPKDAKWPGWLFYAAVHFNPSNPLWEQFPAFNTYVTRCQSFLQAGKPANDILLYYPLADVNSQPATKKGFLNHFHAARLLNIPDVREVADLLTGQGYSWDAISDKLLLKTGNMGSGILINGNNYKTVVVPACQLMPLETFEQLLKLARNGATVVFHKTLPVDVPGLHDLKVRQASLKALKEQLHFKTEGVSQVAVCGQGRVVVADDVEASVVAAGVKPEPLYAFGLQCIRRVTENGSFYFIKNPSSKPFAGWLKVNANFRSAAVFNPMTGQTGYATIRQEGANTPEFYLQLQPNESLIVSTFNAVHTGREYPFYTPAGTSVSLDRNPWQVDFVKGGPVLPLSKRVNQLTSWTDYGADYADFSGTAVYTTRLPRLKKAEAWKLNLGTVHESAEVFLNGRLLGTVINAPFTLTIPGHLLKGKDELQVRVVNLMANRIAYMDKNNLPWRHFYNINFSARLPEDKGADGVFTAKNWMPKVSGLCGDVSLTPMKLLTK